MAGWIKLHRKTLDNPVITKDTEHLAVWMYLLLNATHTNYESIFKKERVTLKPGQLITGRKSISKELKVSESKVQRILKTFEIEQQIEQQTSSQNRLITIVNWNEYQKDEHQNEQQVNNERTTSEQQVNTNKNERREEGKNERIKDKGLVVSDDIKTIANIFESNGFGTINSTTVSFINNLLEDYKTEWIIKAMEEAVKQNKRRLNYVEGILKNWETKGINYERGEESGSYKENNESNDFEGLGFKFEDL